MPAPGIASSTIGINRFCKPRDATNLEKNLNLDSDLFIISGFRLDF
jgi:hypothetical protein